MRPKCGCDALLGCCCRERNYLITFEDARGVQTWDEHKGISARAALESYVKENHRSANRVRAFVRLADTHDRDGSWYKVEVFTFNVIPPTESRIELVPA